MTVPNHIAIIMDGNRRWAKSKNLPVCVHIINGLPGETEDDMIQTARDISLLNQMKDYILDLINATPLELFNQLMNCENNNISYNIKLFRKEND